MLVLSVQMGQQRDRLKGIDNLVFGIKSWVDIRVNIMDIPTQFCWPHLWDAEDFDKLRNKCCLHFGLDRTQPDGKSKFDTKLVKFNFDTNQPFLIFMSEKYDNKLCHLIPTFVTMSRDLQDKFVLIVICFKLDFFTTRYITFVY